MRLAVSNIAWSEDEDAEVQRALTAAGVDALEVAPTRLWPDPTAVTEADAAEAAARFRDDGLEVVAFQSLLFGRPQSDVFGGEREQAELLDYLSVIARLAGAMGARRLVFGSPRNRKVPQGMGAAKAFDHAVEFFRTAATRAQDAGTKLCIEPNPPVYGCDFVTTGAEGIALVQAVDARGFGLHLDVAGLALAGDDPSLVAAAAGPLVDHVHLSAPQLGALSRDGVDHESFGAALSGTGYSGAVSIEMRAGERGANVDRVLAAVALARECYPV